MTNERFKKFCDVCNHPHWCYERVTSNPAPQPEEPEAIALLRELNDIVWGVIPSDLQARVDAVLDRAEEKR